MTKQHSSQAQRLDSAGLALDMKPAQDADLDGTGLRVSGV
jgi:hypothetical protein